MRFAFDRGWDQLGKAGAGAGGKETRRFAAFGGSGPLAIGGGKARPPDRKRQAKGAKKQSRFGLCALWGLSPLYGSFPCPRSGRLALSPCAGPKKRKTSACASFEFFGQHGAGLLLSFCLLPFGGGADAQGGGFGVAGFPVVRIAAKKSVWQSGASQGKPFQKNFFDAL